MLYLSAKELHYFQKTAEYENITKAAEELHLVQPALSRSISNLEDYLGTKLFDRNGRNIALNDKGRIVKYHADRILKEIEAIEKELSDESELIEKTVTLSIYASSSFIPELLAGFKEENPDVRILVNQSRISAENEKETDLSIFSDIVPIENENTVPILSERLLLAIPDTHPLAGSKSVSLSDFKDEGFISLRLGAGLRDITDTYCLNAGFKPSIILESDSPQAVRAFIKAGLGIAFVPEITWREVRGKNIKLIPIKQPECVRHICLSWRDSEYLSSAAKKLKDFMILHFRDYAGNSGN